MSITQCLMQNTRSHSSVFIRSIPVCVCFFITSTRAEEQQQKRDHFGAVAIEVHRMLHHDSTVLTVRVHRCGLDLRWPATYEGSAQELACEPGRHKYSQLLKLTHTIFFFHTY